MFAHIISPRQSVHYQGMPTYLSLAIGLVLIGGSVQVQAANKGQVYNELPAEGVLVEPKSDSSSKVVYKRSQSSKITADESKLADKDFVAMKANLFVECTQVQSSAARLACFDQVAQQGTTPSYTMTKQPLDLAKTLKTTVTGKPQVILAEEGTDTNGLLANQSEFNQSPSNEGLDTIGLTEREAQVLEDVGVTQADIEKYTPLSLIYDLDKNSERGTWTLRPHNPNYILPLFYTVDPNLSPGTPSQEQESFTSNDIRNTELKFQLSFKSKVAEDLFNTNADLWFGYTQQSHWQVYNEDNSRPFRATDYQPEIFLTQPVTANLPFGGRLRMLGVGAVHHSNGKSDPISRSWNRVYLMGGAEWGKFSVIPRIWTRIKNENEDKDDNPDIEDFMGHGDVTFLYDLPNQKSLSGTLRYNAKTNKGAAQIDYIYPLTKNLNGYVQLFQGYGESLIDYNYENTAIGVGIVLNDWKGF
ncbi:phospholipase A [Psychrobacter frigidicola]|uniref:Phospholipase A1 n=1 Tax=Psychrobacter frigidicola TaxID=45611 RepID=A0A5C7A8C7_9GAMM|nr:phospholipase A [Psychrobacter frigidicola]TXD97010.1 phospholipase A [Psychrobacter frigidicola]